MHQFFYEHRLRETGVSEVMAELPPAEIHHNFTTNRTFKKLNESTTRCVVATSEAHHLLSYNT